MIRKADKTDLSSVIELMQLFLVDRDITVPEDVIEVTSEFLLSHEAYTLFLSADEHRNALGMVTVAELHDEPDNQNMIFLENLFVRAEARGKGIASSLIKHTQNQSSGLVGVGVIESQIPSVGVLFNEHGFIEADAKTETILCDALEKLPLERGAEGPLKYLTFRKH